MLVLIMSRQVKHLNCAFIATVPSPWNTRELKQRRRQRQRERHKTIGLMSKNNRSARAFYVFGHFFAVISKTAT